MESDKLGLTGWCMNTERNTVIGHIQGHENLINEMKIWLQSKGSPKSQIENAVFTNIQEIGAKTFSDFQIRT